MGGKSAAPAAPDYVGQANATAAGNLASARSQTAANRIDQVTPYGNIKYAQGDGFDEGGYQHALAEWDKTNAQFLDPNNAQMQAFIGAGGKMPPKPTREQFITNPDHWSSQIELSATGQQLLDADSRARLGLAGLQDEAMRRVSDVSATPFDTSGLININDQTGMDEWQKYSDLLMQRMNPDLDAQQAALDAKLANQGLTQGSEGWGTQQSQFGKQRTDAGVAAQLAGAQVQNQFFSQALQGNQATLQQRAYLRSIPINELNALRSGAQVTNPTFFTPGQQGQTSGPDLMGAANSSYQNRLNSVNAENAQSAQTTASGIGAVATIAAAFY